MSKENIELGAAEALSRTDCGDAILVDVREEAERVMGYPAGSIHHALSAMTPESLKSTADNNDQVVFICAGGVRSLQAAAMARAAGVMAFSVQQGVAAWREQNLPWAAADTAFASGRYARQMILPEMGVDGQRKLKASRAVIVGAGGLGSPVALYLAAAGVGQLVLIDDDRVEMSNLHRQILHAESRLGVHKVASASEVLTDVNSEISIHPLLERVSSKNVAGLIDQADVVVDCSDNLDTRYALNDACVAAQIPLVYGAIFRFEGQVSVFDSRNGPCYRCLFPEPPPADDAPNCAQAGVLGVLPGVIGTLQATEAIKVLLGLGRPLVGRLLLFNAMNGGFREVKLRADSNCPACARG
ncbi:MAG: molybdopterin biosynthesis protein MoeB [Lysobacteraceae bacterium]|nr:MAG: molybdopterin biosynthesis protein MoeB [Xanthomonadaceae bacterium]